MITIAQFAKKKKVAKATVYSWIYRKQTQQHGFEVVKIGKVILIKPRIK